VSNRTELILFLSYFLAGPLAWLAYGVLMYAGRRKMLLLRRPVPPIKAEPLPKVTILIPAKDEGERIRACIQSVLDQDYPNLEVITIDDRSTDNTGAVMDDIAARHARLKAFHNTVAPPPGWTGKNNALHQGQKHADGDWLLFVDSDVVLQLDVLSSCMEMLVRKDFDMVSLLPRLESHSTWESLLVPLCASAASSMYLVPLTNNHLMKNTAFGNGQFLMLKRTAYDAIGGHETVRDRYCEDVEIARLLKTTGWKPRVAWGSEFCSVRMYNSLENIFKGWGRIFYAGRAGSPWRVLGAVLAVLLCCYTGYLALAFGLYRAFVPSHALWGYAAPAWLAASLLHLGLLTAFLGTMYHWSGNPRRNALMFPVGGAMLLAIFFKALKMCVTKKVEWRGTSYSHVMADTLGTPAHGAKAG
jgi:glycosyltransferase involved in cell wall biosynthesis